MMLPSSSAISAPLRVMAPDVPFSETVIRAALVRATRVLNAGGTIIYQHLGYDQGTWAAFVAFLDEL